MEERVELVPSGSERERSSWSRGAGPEDGGEGRAEAG